MEEPVLPTTRLSRVWLVLLGDLTLYFCLVAAHTKNLISPEITQKYLQMSERREAGGVGGSWGRGSPGSQTFLPPVGISEDQLILRSAET